jgi:hypothetical protein
LHIRSTQTLRSALLCSPQHTRLHKTLVEVVARESSQIQSFKKTHLVAFVKGESKILLSAVFHAKFSINLI